jgi:hypothetical protein
MDTYRRMDKQNDLIGAPQECEREKLVETTSSSIIKEL